MPLHLDYVEHLSERGSGLIRLYGFDRRAARSLWSVFRALSRSRVAQLPLHEQGFATSRNPFRLICRVQPKSVGIGVAGSVATGFVWNLPPEIWRDAASLTATLLDPRPGEYQWLPVGDSDIEVLLSPTGEW
jgi:hypothetical protein